MDILEEIVAHKRIEIDQRKQFIAPRQLYGMVAQKLQDAPATTVKFATSLMESETGIIAEFKRMSPSKGWINKDAKSSIVPLSYQKNGATALSILTDTDYFGGYDEFVQDARATGVTIPILYKNFVIDEYQLFQASFCGASAVLLIAVCLSKAECKSLMSLAHELGLEVLLEMHDRHDLEYAELQPDMYGINNRNLGSFVTDVNNSFKMAEQLPADVCKVSESGIDNPETLKSLREAGYNGFLMGECFMKTSDPGEALNKFISNL
ncbi:indole-3-glycerol phosphate synthase [Prevotella herbatica]|uniref:indole-3-glycerol-phosphate synthase n=1 Tax=Prevotella herbatica TaxID=2801997 RepID=A0ABM7NZZ1_9BACT|nr:indole-3-glycerol phosphate synthase TrpC [Prevotella herbatica]BCS86044.1 indole-3-glycerol phosphate synthase [Prevotella herbatica]